MSASFVRRLGIASAFTLGLIISLQTFGAGSASGYSWKEILVPSIGPLGSAFGINDKGQVAVSNLDNSITGIYRNGIFTRLPAPPAGYAVAALGINNGGTVIGGAHSAADPSHEQGFILTGSAYRFFSRPGWDNTEARAISQSALVTGYSYDDALTAFAGFIYDPRTGTFTDATPPGSGAGFSITQGMNADGQISGDGRSSDVGRYAFVWQQGTLVKGKRELAPFLARVNIADGPSAARGINDAGYITGFAGSGGRTVGFVGLASRGFTLLVPPGGDAADAITVCEGINNSRQVVCSVSDTLGNTRGFIGSPDSNDNEQ
ncbi:MAG TPA: hypothetical protein VKB50_26550 [Vicinamibacterales bacterium]|nr:hypothetical protein [Vicinamibacterales bacterium]